MAYSDFSLDRVTKNFDLTISDKIDTFAAVSELEPSTLLAEILKDNIPLALSSHTEKARCEMIIAPILIELRKQLNLEISLFSGIDFTVDVEKGLNGNCDFVIGHSPELLIVRAPIIMIVKAKKENINGGLGQCVAEMLAARIFNQREGKEIPAIYGTVTTGTIWKFLKLQEQIIEIDLGEYYLREVKKILGILANSIRN
jgi:hypothetical protein